MPAFIVRMIPVTIVGLVAQEALTIISTTATPSTTPYHNHQQHQPTSLMSHRHRHQDDTLERLFAENVDLQQTGADALTTALTNWEPIWYNVADQAVVAVKAFHDLSGIEYGWSIVGVTVIIRLGLFPLMIQSQRTSSRMAHVQPELSLLRERYEALGSTPSRQEQAQYFNKVKALFARYEVKPSRAFVAPVVQIPVFMGMFFGLRKMPNIYPDELATGGMFWFENLNNPDPLYILPVLSGLTFLAVIELGKQDMAATMSSGNGQLMVNVFRFMAIGMMYVFLFVTALLFYDMSYCSLLAYWILICS
jgi:YidC/Oxa1 family membrane protein insertase